MHTALQTYVTAWLGIVRIRTVLRPQFICGHPERIRQWNETTRTWVEMARAAKAEMAVRQ